MGLRGLRPWRSLSEVDRIDDLAMHPDLDLLLDPRWYLGKHPDVLVAGLDAAEHFLSSGAAEWRSPSPYVDLRFAAESLPPARRTGPAVVRHLLGGGFDAGAPISPFVDLGWFRRRIGADALPARATLRALMGRDRSAHPDPSPWLDLDWYGKEIPAVHLGGLDAFEYFLAMGRWLGRFPHPAWDEARYLDLNDYVRIAVGSGKYSSGFEQFCAVGWTKTARETIALPLILDGKEVEYSESGYLASNPDVQGLLEAGEVTSGLEHLLTVGHREVAAGERRLKDPSPLSRASTRSTGREPSGELLVLLNHFDVDDVIDPHLRIAMEAYRSVGADVVLITTAAVLTSVDDLVTHVIAKSRNDDLRDFGGWNHALRSLPDGMAERYRRVILTNDSVYFPVRDPSVLVDRMLASPADVFAATDSVSGGRYHLQSYFLGLSQKALRELRPELERRVLEQAEATKLTLVQRFEVGLSAYLLAQGLTTEVFAPVSAISDIASSLSPPDCRPVSRLSATVLNVTHHLWRHTLRHELPFLKVELLRDNPLGVDIEGWQEEVSGSCSAEIIETHLARVRR